MIKYNKELVNPINKVVIKPPIPNTKVVKDYRAENIKLGTDKTYTQYEVDSIVNKVSEELSIELENKYMQNELKLSIELDAKKSSVLVLEKEVNHLNAKLDAKDAMIIELTKQVNSIINNNRSMEHSTPQDDTVIVMDTLFIDPSVKGAENKMQNYITVEEIKGDGVNVKDSVNKLKSILGKRS